MTRLFFLPAFLALAALLSPLHAQPAATTWDEPAAPPPQPLTFLTQESPEPGYFDPATTSTLGCQLPLNPMDVICIEPSAGVTASTGVLIHLAGIGVDCDRPRTSTSPDPAWPDSKDVIVARVFYRNLPFYPPYDFGKYQIIDVLRGLNAVLEHYPQVDKRRLYLYGESGGGHLALQTLHASRGVWAEAHVHSAITKISVRDDVLNAGYDHDPSQGWNTNTRWPVTQDSLDDFTWQRVQAERALRSPQTNAANDAPYTSDPSPASLPLIWMFHGMADNVVDDQHFTDFRAALENRAGTAAQAVSPTQWSLGNWNLVAIVNGGHAYSGAAPGENTRAGATNTYAPNAFTRSRATAPTLALDYLFPEQQGFSYRIHGTTLGTTTLEMVFPEAAVSGSWILYP
ncbi:MAG: Prolyl oligopeptidase family [Candidatus Sumerlaeota bacterium]|nr:Prolyl oligopeptidase family [Candidatus Sumerlaeota bacterium]